jgi:L-cysteine S-thiosulfotransferase
VFSTLNPWVIAVSIPVVLFSTGALAQTTSDSLPGEAVRGRAIVANRTLSLCTLCHVLPIPEERFQGNIGPDLSEVGSRYSAQALRLRIANAAATNPQTIMPSYEQTSNLNRVAANWAGKPLLTPQQIDDVVAYLQTLRESK